MFAQFFRGLGAATRHNALAYGYSLALTGAFGMIDTVDGPPRPDEILLFGVGGAVTFTVLTAVTTRGFRKRSPEHKPIVRAVGASLGAVSVTAAIASAWLVAWLVGDWPAWLLGSFVASTVYLAGSAVELGLAQLLRPVLGDELEELEESS